MRLSFRGGGEFLHEAVAAGAANPNPNPNPNPSPNPSPNQVGASEAVVRERIARRAKETGRSVPEHLIQARQG